MNDVQLQNAVFDNRHPKPAIGTNIRFGRATVTKPDGSFVHLPTVMRVKPRTGINQIKVVTFRKETKIKGGSLVGPGMVALWTTDPFSIIGKSRTWDDWDKTHIVNFNHPY